ncbi:hypothetical protein [Streptomyces sp. NPDC003393]
MKKTGRAKRTAAVGAAASALTAGLVLGVAAPQASAAPSWNTFSYSIADGSVSVTVYNGSKVAGKAAWAANPGDLGISTGDTLVVSDVLADGYGIEAHLSDGRTATTRGKASPYTAKKSGNLPEDGTYYMSVCMVKGSYSDCLDTWTVRS